MAKTKARRVISLVYGVFTCALVSLLSMPVMAQSAEKEPEKGMDHSMHEAMDHSMHQGMDHNMVMDATGMVMNQNLDKLPEDCAEISGEYEIKVIAGTDYAKPYAGTTFGFNEHQWKVEPCSRITVTFKNEDDVRHQWMIHRLPKYLYDQGMFHMEAAGGQTQTGTFIVPSDDRTYLVHCDIAQHMEKGMKAQLIVGKGSGDLWSIPGVSAGFERKPLIFSQWHSIALLLFFIIVCLTTVAIFGNRKQSGRN
jgi:plastocyanin